jgi:hypothetical protein
MTIRHLVMFSGGACSYIAAKRVIQRHGKYGVVLLFADTLIEDPTLYSFLDDAEKALGVEVTRVSDGRTPFEVFSDVRFLGNSRVDPCSRILKRDLLNKWREDNCDPEVTVTHFGLDFNEPHRLKRVRKLHAPWKVEAYLTQRPVVTKEDMLDEIREDGLEPCDLYRHGFSHANCGGGCIKSGIAQFTLLLKTHPDRYAIWEESERMMREKLDKDISILKDRRGGTTKPLTLKALRERINCGGQLTFDESTDWGGCGCAVE